MEKFNKVIIAVIAFATVSVICTGCSNAEENKEPEIVLPEITVTVPAELKGKVTVKVQYEEPAPAQVPATTVVTIDNLDEYKTLEVLKANEAYAKQDLENAEDYLKRLVSDREQLEKAVAAGTAAKGTVNKIQELKFQERLAIHRVEHTKKYVAEKVAAVQQAEEAIKQRDAANKKYAWYNPKGWF